MEDTIKDEVDEVEDLYLEHSQHFTYQEKCSICFNNVKEFDEN